MVAPVAHEASRPSDKQDDFDDDDDDDDDARNVPFRPSRCGAHSAVHCHLS